MVGSVYHDQHVPCLIEVDADVSASADRLSETEYEEKSDELHAKYKSAVEAVTAILGNPDFDGESTARGLPDDQDAVCLALWQTKGARYMIQEKNEDWEMPFRLCVTVAPGKPGKPGQPPI
jgi:hypothetical protein